MNISKAAEASGLSVKTVRYYSDVKLVSPAGRTEAGYREYSASEVRKLGFVRRARAFGFSVEECRELLDLYQNTNRSSADVKKMAQQRLHEIEEKQRELKHLRDELSHLVNACHGDDRPDCPIMDYLS